jgi:two-component system, OmpR family, phosphate regulon sensor histidine kinase PhoR
MLWPILTCLALAAAIALHLWWRARFLRAQAMARNERDRLQQEHQQAELQLRTQQQALFDSMAEGLLLLDDQGRIRLANRAFTKLFGPSGDVRSRTILEALRLHELAELVSLLGEKTPVLATELKLSRPSERWLEINGAAIFNGDGRRYGTVMVFHDLTRLKQLENTRKDFVANVSHELRTPLSLIKGYLETLLDGAKDDAAVAAKFLRTIQRNADRLQLLIEDLLAISELESGDVQLNLETVLVGPIVRRVLEDFRARAEAKRVELADETAGLRVRADPARLEQVLGNLVDNAIKYGRVNGRVTVGGAALPEGQVRLFVRDDGGGIPPESLGRLFERFYRVDKARSREQGGTGLGLAIVKHIVQSHGGKVWAESQLGQGATFSFTLPAHDE